MYETADIRRQIAGRSAHLLNVNDLRAYSKLSNAYVLNLRQTSSLLAKRLHLLFGHACPVKWNTVFNWGSPDKMPALLNV
jgi:hypothetical protein